MQEYRPGTNLWQPAKPDMDWARYLRSGEVIIWEGRPSAGLKLDRPALLQTASGLFTLVFALVWISIAISATGVSLFSLFGIPFVAVGAYLFIGHFFWDAYKRARMRYALSNERAFIANRAWGREISIYTITPQTELVLREHGEQAASIFFAKEQESKSSKKSWLPRHKNIGFRWVREGAEVYRMMSEIQAGRHASQS